MESWTYTHTSKKIKVEIKQIGIYNEYMESEGIPNIFPSAIIFEFNKFVSCFL
jgi:hypothetical protein